MSPSSRKAGSSDDKPTAWDELAEKVDNLVRNHTRREPYISNVAKRIVGLLQESGAEPAVGRTDYERGYNNGYVTGLRKATKVSNLTKLPDERTASQRASTPGAAQEEE